MSSSTDVSHRRTADDVRSFNFLSPSFSLANGDDNPHTMAISRSSAALRRAARPSLMSSTPLRKNLAEWNLYGQSALLPILSAWPSTVKLCTVFGRWMVYVLLLVILLMSAKRLDFNSSKMLVFSSVSISTPSMYSCSYVIGSELVFRELSD